MWRLQSLWLQVHNLFKGVAVKMYLHWRTKTKAAATVALLTLAPWAAQQPIRLSYLLLQCPRGRGKCFSSLWRFGLRRSCKLRLCKWVFRRSKLALSPTSWLLSLYSAQLMLHYGVHFWINRDHRYLIWVDCPSNCLIDLVNVRSQHRYQFGARIWCIRIEDIYHPVLDL